jgi:hypothetical protein
MASLGCRGKTLQFQFDPLDGLNVNDETKQPEATMFKALLRVQTKSLIGNKSPIALNYAVTEVLSVKAC